MAVVRAAPRYEARGLFLDGSRTTTILSNCVPAELPAEAQTQYQSASTLSYHTLADLS